MGQPWSLITFFIVAANPTHTSGEEQSTNTQTNSDVETDSSSDSESDEKKKKHQLATDLTCSNKQPFNYCEPHTHFQSAAEQIPRQSHGCPGPPMQSAASYQTVLSVEQDQLPSFQACRITNSTEHRTTQSLFRPGLTLQSAQPNPTYYDASFAEQDQVPSIHEYEKLKSQRVRGVQPVQLKNETDKAMWHADDKGDTFGGQIHEKHVHKQHKNENPKAETENPRFNDPMFDFIKEQVRNLFSPGKPLPMKFFDAAIVYDKRDYDKAEEMRNEMKALIRKELNEDLQIELFDSEEFTQSMVLVVEDIVKKTFVILVYLSRNTDGSGFVNFFVEEAVGMTRLGLKQPGSSYINDTNSDCQFLLKPVHTKSPEVRDYKTPVGLITMNGIDWYDKYSKYTRDKIVAMMKSAISKRKRRENEGNVTQNFKHASQPVPVQTQSHRYQNRYVDNMTTGQSAYIPQSQIGHQFPHSARQDPNSFQTGGALQFTAPMAADYMVQNPRGAEMMNDQTEYHWSLQACQGSAPTSFQTSQGNMLPHSRPSSTPETHVYANTIQQQTNFQQRQQYPLRQNNPVPNQELAMENQHHTLYHQPIIGGHPPMQQMHADKVHNVTTNNYQEGRSFQAQPIPYQQQPWQLQQQQAVYQHDQSTMPGYHARQYQAPGIEVNQQEILPGKVSYDARYSTSHGTVVEVSDLSTNDVEIDTYMSFSNDSKKKRHNRRKERTARKISKTKKRSKDKVSSESDSDDDRPFKSFSDLLGSAKGTTVNIVGSKIIQIGDKNKVRNEKKYSYKSDDGSEDDDNKRNQKHKTECTEAKYRSHLDCTVENNTGWENSQKPACDKRGDADAQMIGRTIIDKLPAFSNNLLSMEKQPKLLRTKDLKMPVNEDTTFQSNNDSYRISLPTSMTSNTSSSDFSRTTTDSCQNISDTDLFGFSSCSSGSTDRCFTPETPRFIDRAFKKISLKRQPSDNLQHDSEID